MIEEEKFGSLIRQDLFGLLLRANITLAGVERK